VSAAATDLSTLPGAGIKPALSLRRHPRAAAWAALLVLLLGLPFAWFRGAPFYNSEAVFQVAPTYMKNLEADRELELQSNSQYREFVHHLSNTVTRQDVLERALAELKAQRIDLRPQGMTERKYLEFLQRTIYVRAVPDTYMVRIGTDADRPEHLHALINAVARAFVETTRDEQIFGAPERLTALRDTMVRLNGEVADLSAQRLLLAERLGLTTFSDSTVNPYDSTLAQSRERLAAATADRLRAEATLAAFARHKELPSGQGRSMLEMRLQDNGLQALRNEVVRRGEELTRQMAGLEGPHPVRQSAGDELLEIQRRMKDQEANFDRGTSENVRARLQASLAERVQVEEEIRTAHAGLEAQARDFARNFQEAMRLTQEIKKRDTDLTRVRERLNYLGLETQALGFVRLVTEALPAETPRGIGRKKMLVGVLLATLLAALAAPVALDMLDRRLRTVNDAEKLLGMAAAGWQVQAEGLGTERLAQEQARRFASALMRNRQRGGPGLVGFAAAKPGAGVTHTVMETARVLAELGERVLVVELNAMRPHPDFAGALGLSDFLAGDATLEGLPVAREGAGRGFDTVGIGCQAQQGLVRLDRLKSALAQWASTYDHVLCDLPPLLLSGDAELAVPLVGQVFLVVDAEGVSRGEVLRAKRLLQKLDPEAVGLFVNRIPVFAGSGYLEPLIVETLTRTRFEKFMTQPRWRLAWELVRLHLAGGRRRQEQGSPP
jgi:Mrp family chromosome partitioning ATPase